MPQTKQCKQCNQQFTVEDDDLAFYKKISPTLAGKTYEIPPPTLCPNCRMRIKLAFRNENKFYKRKCDLTGQEIISLCSPECQYKVYKQSEWLSDKWSPLEYGRDVDFNRPFLDQLKELALDVPTPHASLVNNENSEYIANASNCKDSYLISNATSSENCMFGVGYWYSKDCVDCYKVFYCENCYEVVAGYNSYSCFWSKDIKNCSESYFLEGCVGCKNCFACSNLNNKQYWAFNKPSSLEEINKLVRSLTSGKQMVGVADGAVLHLIKQPKKYSQIFASENSDGNYLDHCKQVQGSYFVNESENVKYSSNLSKSKDTYDTSFVGSDMERIYNCVTVGFNIGNVISSAYVYHGGNNIFYSFYCIHNCQDLFGCVGLKKLRHCILNKQYSKLEYEGLAARIIEHMRKTGEWGEFLPVSFSHFGYNESLANYYFPIERLEAEKIGADWLEGDYNIAFDDRGSYTPLESILDYDPESSANAKDEIDRLLKSILKCSKTERPFRLVAKEVLFYIKNKLPIPTVHPEVRQAQRFVSSNPMKLWHRQCTCEEQGHDHEGRCSVEFETTYAPDRPEKIYCESCYQKSVI